MAFVVDKFTLNDGRTRYLLIDGDKLEVRTYQLGSNGPKCEDDHPHAKDLCFNRFGNKVSFGDFACGEIGKNNTIKYSKGDFAVRNLINSYLGCKEVHTFKDF